MKRCPNCSYENTEANMYCERCGTALPNPDAHFSPGLTYINPNEAYLAYPPPPAMQVQSDSQFASAPPPTTQEQPYFYQTPVDVPPPPPLAGTYAPNPGPGPGYGYKTPPANEPRKRGIGTAILSSIFYLLGAFCLALGLAGFILYGMSTATVGAVFIIVSIVAVIILILLLIFRKFLYLKSWVRILTVVGLTVVGIVSLLVSAVMTQPDISYPTFGIIFIFYGFVTSAVAFW